MSNFTKVPNEILESDLGTGEKMVLIALLKYQNTEMMCPGIATLSRLTGLCEKTVRIKIASLEQKGVLHVIRRKKQTSVYRYSLPVSDTAIDEVDRYQLPHIPVNDSNLSGTSYLQIRKGINKSFNKSTDSFFDGESQMKPTKEEFEKDLDEYERRTNDQKSV